MSSVSGTSSTTSTYANRITGLASGLDVDSLVKQMLKADNARMDKLKQQKQLTQWKQDAYRDVLSDIQDFKSAYFDILKSDTYMLSSADFTLVDATPSTTGFVTATCGADVQTGTYSLSNISMATKASYIGSNSINISQADTSLTLTSPITIGSTNDKLTIKIGTSSYDVTIADTTYSSAADFVSAINTALKTAQPSGGGTAVDLTATNGISVAIPNSSSNIQIQSGCSDYVNVSGEILYKMGYSSMNFEVNMGSSIKMSDLFSAPGYVDFTINGKDISYNFAGADKDKSISDIMTDISSKAGVDMRYNELTREFEMYSTTTGASQKFDATTTIDKSGNFLSTLFGTPVNTPGTDATATLKEPNMSVAAPIEKSTNTFTINGVTYNLLSNTNSTTPAVNLTMTSDVDKAYDKIKTFIDKYNDIVTKIQTQITEKKDSDYPPLTDDQKSGMTQDQIKNWEDKAKEGMLHNDSNLQNMLSSLRSAFYDTVQGAGINLTDTGLSTTDDYLNGGTINIDSTKLKTALKNNGGQVMNLFTKSSTLLYDPDHKTGQTRYNEEGVFQRINDILKDYTRTTRSSSGAKGILVDIAGLKGDGSELTNTLYKELTDENKKISDMAKKITSDENKYYQEFTQLETTMQQLNTQQSYLSAMLGSK